MIQSPNYELFLSKIGITREPTYAVVRVVQDRVRFLTPVNGWEPLGGNTWTTLVFEEAQSAARSQRGLYCRVDPETQPGVNSKHVA